MAYLGVRVAGNGGGRGEVDVILHTDEAGLELLALEDLAEHPQVHRVYVYAQVVDHLGHAVLLEQRHHVVGAVW